MSGTHLFKQQMNIKTHKSDMPFPYIFYFLESGCTTAVKFLNSHGYYKTARTAKMALWLQRDLYNWEIGLIHDTIKDYSLPQNVQTSPWPQAPSCSMGTGVLYQGWSGWVLKVYFHSPKFLDCILRDSFTFRLTLSHNYLLTGQQNKKNQHWKRKVTKILTQ